MSEEKKEESVINTEELKKDASTVVNEVKDNFKDVNMKKEGKEAKGFIKELFKNPIDKVQDMVKENNGKYFKYAIIVLAIWTVVDLILAIYAQRGVFFNIFTGFSNLLGFSTSIGAAILSIFLALITPTIAVIIMTLIAFLFNKQNKKSFLTVLSGVTIAKLPVVAAEILCLLNMAGPIATKITSPFKMLTTVVSTVLMYFTLKSVFGAKKDSEFFYKFLIVEAIYYAAYIVLSFIGIYI